jgi:hypothetical protein
LRDLAQEEARKRSICFDKVLLLIPPLGVLLTLEQAHNAYSSGGGVAAHECSEEGKAHAAKMDAYNKQAFDYIFRENNALGRVANDTIDLHRQFVEEAKRILEDRIRYAQLNGQSGLHV